MGERGQEQAAFQENLCHTLSGRSILAPDDSNNSAIVISPLSQSQLRELYPN